MQFTYLTRKFGFIRAVCGLQFFYRAFKVCGNLIYRRGKFGLCRRYRRFERRLVGGVGFFQRLYGGVQRGLQFTYLTRKFGFVRAVCGLQIFYRAFKVCGNLIYRRGKFVLGCRYRRFERRFIGDIGFFKRLYGGVQRGLQFTYLTRKFGFVRAVCGLQIFYRAFKVCGKFINRRGKFGFQRLYTVFKGNFKPVG